MNEPYVRCVKCRAALETQLLETDRNGYSRVVCRCGTANHLVGRTLERVREIQSGRAPRPDLRLVEEKE